MCVDEYHCVHLCAVQTVIQSVMGLCSGEGVGVGKLFNCCTYKQVDGKTIARLSNDGQICEDTHIGPLA